MRDKTINADAQAMTPSRWKIEFDSVDDRTLPTDDRNRILIDGRTCIRLISENVFSMLEFMTELAIEIVAR